MLSFPAPRAAIAAVAVLAGAASATAQPVPRDQPPKVAQPQVATPAEAKAFVESAEARLLEMSNRLGRAQWVAANFITQDTEKIAAEANKDMISLAMDLAAAATR